MGEFLPGDERIREYLLGRVSDEATLEGLEDLLFTDEDFCSRVALAEDELINDYVFGRLNNEDAESFQTTLAGNSERNFKVELTRALRARAVHAKAPDERPSLLRSLKAFFHQPQYVGALAILLVAAIALVVYFSRKPNPDQLAELRSIYQQARPTETRLAEFGYAPLPQLRGAPEPGEQKRLRRIENNLIDANEANPTAETHHALGVFNLTQQKYPEAIKELESAAKLANQSARIHNDLGAAHFELSKTLPREKRVADLAQSLEEFTRATELDGNFLEALFNKSLALQELGMPRQAKESWTLYLQKDPSSAWADEARKHLAQIDSEQTRSKSDENVLADFLLAYRSHDDARAQKIHHETKGLLKSITVPLQLSKRYLLARQRRNEAEANESIEAMAFIGRFERKLSGESFFFELANFYASVDANKIERLLQAKDTFAGGLMESDSKKAISAFESSRALFAQVGDECESAIAENWAAQLLPDVARVAESRRRLSAIIANAESKKFIVLLSPAYYTLGIGDYRQNRLSESARNLKSALRFAEESNNTFEIQHAEDALALNYSQIGELEPALFYAGKLLSHHALYFQSPRQSLRNKGTLAYLTLKLKFFSTSLSLASEHLSITEQDAPDSSHVNDSLRRMIDAATAKEDFVAALKYVDQSMQIARKRDDSPENTRITATIYLLLADLKSKTKDYDEALADYEQALELYRRLPEVTDSLYQIHKGKLFCYQQLDRQEDFSSELKTVLKLSEEYRATIREDNSRQAFFENEQVVLDAAAANAIRQHQSEQAFTFVEASKARSLLEFVKSGKSIAEVEKDYGSVVRPLARAKIQAGLPEEVQFLQYAVLPDKLAIWIVSKTRFDFVEKAISAADLENKIDNYQALIIGKGSPAEIDRTAQELHELLIPPGLASDKQLCLIPDKSLHQLAFATLISPGKKYLLEDYALFYSPSASVLVLATENARQKEQVRNENLLSVGNPDFDREENPGLPDLETAAAEARSIAADYPKSLELLGGEATREKFLQHFTNAEVIHFAGHFVANQQAPGNSKLLFAGGELRSYELGHYRLSRAKLVVLSACETGFERFNKSEGAIGIARTLLALGAPLVVASQWKVDSEPTKDFMVAFHRNRKAKSMTTAESLRQAQLEMLSKEQTKAPFYWAAFSLFGGYANY